MPTEKDLWTEVGNKCLRRASELLDDKTAPAAATAETVKVLVETAISMDMLNLRWAAQKRAFSKFIPTSVSDDDITTAAQAICGKQRAFLTRLETQLTETEELRCSPGADPE